MAATRFAVVKTDTPGLLHALRQTPNLNRPPRRFAMVKPILIISTGLLQALRQSKSTLQTSTGIFPCMRLSRHLYLATTRLKVVITDSPKLYWTPTRFAVVKTDSPNLYMTFLLSGKPTLGGSTGRLHAMRWSKRTLRTFIGLHALCGSYNRPAEHLHAY